MKTNRSDGLRVRLANEIRQELQQVQVSRLRELIRQAGTLADPLERIQAGRRKLTICLSRGWPTAGAKILSRIEAALRDLPHYVSQLQRQIETHRSNLPAVREIVDELAQLETEFAQVVCNPKVGTISVTTEPIELEGMYLGPFEVRLQVDRITSQAPETSFDIIALDPHPACSNDLVTHPHVSDERMCCGDATGPIKAAIESGRLGDFFCLVRSVLETYNPDSPYVSLDNWQGQSCYDCGYVMSEDETYWCSSCDSNFCGECSSCCMHCDEITCSACLSECAACGDSYCDRCITMCPDCEKAICRTCLEEMECPCIEERQEQEDDDEENQDEQCETSSAIGSPDGRGDRPADSRLQSDAA